MRMVIGDTTPTRVDQTMIRVVAKGHEWFKEFLSGQVTTFAETAKHEKLDKGYVSRTINLAFLAPDIVESIVAGRQPAELTAQKLLRQGSLPLDWTEQRRVLSCI